MTAAEDAEFEAEKERAVAALNRTFRIRAFLMGPIELIAAGVIAASGLLWLAAVVLVVSVVTWVAMVRVHRAGIERIHQLERPPTIR